MAGSTDPRLARAELEREGPRVRVRTIRAGDEPAYRAAVLRSRPRLTEWNPADPADFGPHLAGQGSTHRTFLIIVRDSDEAQPLVGKVNVSNVVYGRFRSGTLGYDAFDPHVGTGMFGEGLRLIVGLALARVTDGGMGLHRVEANVQPGNERSAGVLRSLGFQPEGASRDLLWLPDASGREAWRDHVRYAVTSGDWPAEPYSLRSQPQFLVLVDTAGTAERSQVAADMAAELGLPVFDALDLSALPGSLSRLVSASTVGAVVVGDLSGSAVGATIAALPDAVPEAVIVTVTAGQVDAVSGPGAGSRLALSVRGRGALGQIATADWAGATPAGSGVSRGALVCLPTL